MFCETEAEAFADPARELIFQVARGYLERRGITATDLVFDPKQHRALLDDGARFQEILQRVALLQGQHTKRPVSERMKELTALAEIAMRRVERLAGQLPDFTDLDAAVRSGLFAGTELDGWVRAGVVFARLAGRRDDWASRATFCLDLLDRDVQGEVRSMADQTLAEILRLKPAAATLFGEQVNRPAMIEICLGLSGGEARPVATDTPVIARLRQRGLVDLPLTQNAVAERLAEMLGGSLPIGHAEPHEEWQALIDLKRRVAAIPVLAEDERIGVNLSRRLTRFASPELLNPILAREPEIARKLLFLLQLYSLLDDGNARFELLGIFTHYLDHRDFRTGFIGPQATREEFASLAAGISSALVQADIPDQRKAKLLDLFRNQLATVVKPAGQRGGQRGIAGGNDHVLAHGLKAPLRNWSPVGLLFGPCSSGMTVGDRLQMTVVIRNAALSIDFVADAEILRVSDGMVAARYTCSDVVAEQRIKAFFAAAQ